MNLLKGIEVRKDISFILKSSFILKELFKIKKVAHLQLVY